ncbi:MAG: hypothetical protein JO250_09625, partial [Armatimonadetes bacterium]|nr:hypothetical protein [Armatimonadota bacterium]
MQNLINWLTGSAPGTTLEQLLNGWAGAMGPWFYVVMFLVIFCETGLVVTPF